MRSEPSVPGGGVGGTVPAVPRVAGAGTGATPVGTGTTDRPGYEWVDPEPVLGYPVSLVAVWTGSRWRTLARCMHPGDARDLAERWAGEFVVEVWARDRFAPPWRVLHLEPSPARGG